MAMTSPASAENSRNVFVHVPETTAENYTVLYELALPVDGGFFDLREIPYSTDNSESVPDLDRVAYYLELTNPVGTHWVYVSMDAFTNNPKELGLPHNIQNPLIHHRTVAKMNVFSNVGGVVTGSFIDTGNIEMWPGNYGEMDVGGIFAASNERYDWGDNPTLGAGYGSFQIHNAVALQTILAYNHWGVDDGDPDDVGIGSRPMQHPDWTFAANADHYTKRSLLILIRPKTHEVSFTTLPRNRQLVSRDVATNLATVSIAGTESFGGFDRIILRVMRNGILHDQTEQKLSYRSGKAAFSFDQQIEAELARYDFELLLDRGDRLQTVERVNGVVAGDAYLFYGQSNAEASSYDLKRSANEYASEWLSTFGQNGDDADRTRNILYWVQADGDGDRDAPGAVGQWAMVLGRAIIDTYGIPVAILNGARGGYSMPKLQKDRKEPDNLYDDGGTTRTYNRIRYRAIEAGVATTARAIFFYQGESDNGNTRKHTEGFARLRLDWAVDYPGLEHFYVTQVRPGCGPVEPDDIDLREAQRRFCDVYPKTSVMASNGLLSHDGCHYEFTAGYEDLGWHHFRQVGRDLYGAPDDPDIDALNPDFAVFTDANRTALRLVLRNRGATIHFPAEALSDFALVGSPATITSRTVSGTTILFELSAPASENSVLAYRGDTGSGGCVINDSGIGMLSFTEPILEFDAPGLPQGSGGSESLWFGEFDDRHFDYKSNTGWIRHEEHGWLYVGGRSFLKGLWLWDHIQQDWLWTKDGTFPFFFRHNGGDGGWLYYLQGGTPGERDFYDYRAGQWVTAP